MARVRKYRDRWVADFRDQFHRRRIEVPATRSDYRLLLDCYVLPYFGDWKIESVSRLDIEHFRAQMSEGVPEAIAPAREQRVQRRRAHGERVRWQVLAPGPRTLTSVWRSWRRCSAMHVVTTR